MSGPFLPPKELLKGMTADQKKELKNLLLKRQKEIKAKRAKIELAEKRIDKALAHLRQEPKQVTSPQMKKGEFKPKLVKTGTDD